MIDSVRQYVPLAIRTLSGRVRADEFETRMNACTGLASETGEINEILKKHYFHGHPMTEESREHLKKELGDLMWYWALMVWSFGFDPADVLNTNIEKLKARYPEGFSTERSINRAEGDV